MENIIIEELKRRIKDQDTISAIVGPEIKIRRISLNKTLKFIAYHICSISYVSKVESNSIKPNRYFLNEIGKKVNMTEEQINRLFDLRDVLNQGIKEYLFNSNASIKEILDAEGEFVNYRYRLLVFLNSLVVNNFYQAAKSYKELLKIINTMTDYDFKICSLLSSIYLYKIGSVKEACENLKLLSGLEINNDLKNLVDLYMFYCSNVLGKPETIIYYLKTRENLSLVGAFDLLDEVNYLYAFFFIKSGSYDYSLSLLNTIRDKKRKNTIEAIILYYLGKPINNYKKRELLAPAKCLYDYLYDKEQLKHDISSSTKEEFLIDYNPIIFKYLLLENAAEKYSYIISNVVRELKRCDDAFVKKFFIKEIYLLCEQTAKYKALYDVYKIYMREECI